VILFGDFSLPFQILLDQGALAVFRLLPDLWREGGLVLSGCFLPWIDHDFGALSMMEGRITRSKVVRGVCGSP
jgi:hypothetical protein